MAVLSKPMLAALAALFVALMARAAPVPVERRELGIKTVIEGKGTGMKPRLLFARC